MRDLIKMTDEELESALEQRAGIYEYADSRWLTYTADTIEDFKAARAQWAEAGKISKDADGVLQIDNAQPRKGEPRRTITVVDFGDARIVEALTI